MTLSTSGDMRRSARFERILWGCAGAGALLCAWAVVAAGQPEYMFPGPADVWDSLSQMLTTRRLWFDLLFTLERAIVGLIVAVVAGVLLGCACGMWRRVEWFFQPFISLLLCVPAIVFVIVAMVWCGTSSIVVVFVVAVVAFPLVVSSTAQAMRGIDRELIEMAVVFRLSRFSIARTIIFPMIAPPILAAVSVCLGQSIRVSVMAELIAIASGIGGAIRQAQINIDTTRIFAYALVMAGVTFALEIMLVRPLRRRVEFHRSLS